jgi:hypothetical protein
VGGDAEATREVWKRVRQQLRNSARDVPSAPEIEANGAGARQKSLKIPQKRVDRAVIP